MLPKDAISLDEFEALSRGEKIPKKKVKPRPDPEPPVVENHLRLDDIPGGEIRDISARLHYPSVRNRDGQIFVGHDVLVQVGEKTFEGWMGEGDFLKLKKRISPDRIDLLQKISF